MNSNTSDWSSVIVSEKHNDKTSLINAMITSNIVGASIRTEEGTVSLDFQDHNVDDSEFRLLDSEFDFDFDFKLTDSCKSVSRLLPKTLECIPDAKLLIVEANGEQCVQSGTTNLIGLDTSKYDEPSGIEICEFGITSQEEIPHSSIEACAEYVARLLSGSPPQQETTYEDVSNRQGIFN